MYIILIDTKTYSAYRNKETISRYLL